MTLIDHVKNSGNEVEVASGLHILEGDLLYSRVDAGRVYIKHALGDGNWSKIRAIYYKGLAIPATDYHLHPGTLSTGAADPLQGVCSYFPTGLTHSGTTCACVLLPNGVPDLDTVKNPPSGLRLICETGKFPDFDASGNIIDFSYTTNPARCMLGDLMRLGKIKTGIPDTERYFSQYWKNRIWWADWVAWRNHLATTELNDYTTIAGLDGFGLTVSIYNSINFTKFKAKRVEPVIDFQFGSGSPAFGVGVDTYSLRINGKIKGKYSENYTFTVEHDNGAKVWIDDVLIIDEWTTTGTHTGTATLVANQFHTVKIEYFEDIGTANLRLRWSSASQIDEVIPPEALYPDPEQRPLYESHLKFLQATTISKLMRDYLRVSNSGFQDVDGRLKFFSLETRTPSFTFDASNIIRLRVSPRDVRDNELQNVFEAKFLDIDSASLQEATVSIQMDDLQASADKVISGPITPYPNMSRWQARKLLAIEADYAVRNLNRFEVEATAYSYPVMPYDKVLLTSAEYNFTNKPCTVVRAVDKSIEETADDKFFILKEN